MKDLKPDTQAVYIGVDIGGTKCAVVLGDANGGIIDKVRFQTTDPVTTVGMIVDTAGQLADSARKKGLTPVAIGVSCGSPMNSKKGIIMEPPNLPGWVDVPITDMLTRATSLPAYLCNDANACALAEWKYGAGVGTENMIFLTFGTGMGAGLILGGRLYAGTTDNGGEVGHVRLADDGPVGYHKAGSFEGFCSGGGIARLGRTYAIQAYREGIVPAYCPSLDPCRLGAVTAKSIADAAHAGDPTAIRVYETCGERLGQALSVLVDILNPERIVIGSVFARSGDLLIPAMTRVMERECLPDSLAACRVVPAALTENVGDVAALTVAVTGYGEENAK